MVLLPEPFGPANISKRGVLECTFYFLSTNNTNELCKSKRDLMENAMRQALQGGDLLRIKVPLALAEFAHHVQQARFHGRLFFVPMQVKHCAHNGVCSRLVGQMRADVVTQRYALVVRSPFVLRLLRRRLILGHLLPLP
jgi:hypothetical protein